MGAPGEIWGDENSFESDETLSIAKSLCFSTCLSLIYSHLWHFRFFIRIPTLTLVPTRIWNSLHMHAQFNDHTTLIRYSKLAWDFLWRLMPCSQKLLLPYQTCPLRMSHALVDSVRASPDYQIFQILSPFHQHFRRPFPHQPWMVLTMYLPKCWCVGWERLFHLSRKVTSVTSAISRA